MLEGHLKPRRGESRDLAKRCFRTRSHYNQAKIDVTQSATEICQSGNVTPYLLVNLPPFSREFAGRFAGVG